MKKIVLAAALLLTSVATFAQHEVGDFTIQPKVGLNIANTTKPRATIKLTSLVVLKQSIKWVRFSL